MASEQNLPSIQVRMQNLTPTSSVVEYYSSKIDKYEAHLAALMTTLEEYKLSHEHQVLFTCLNICLALSKKTKQTNRVIRNIVTYKYGMAILKRNVMC